MTMLNDEEMEYVCKSVFAKMAAGLREAIVDEPDGKTWSDILDGSSQDVYTSTLWKRIEELETELAFAKCEKVSPVSYTHLTLPTKRIV